MNPNALLRALFFFVLAAAAARAEVRLHNLFTDHMVLQQDTTVPVWGWAEEGEKVTVEFRGQSVSTKAKDGRWMVQLKNLKPGPAETLKVFSTAAGASARNTVIQVHDVLVGEVWLASGQSNMEWPLNRSFDSTNDIRNSANPNIRLFTVPKLKLNQPTNNVKASWKECAPDNVPGFSAVAYYFARDLQRALGVPVGIIHTSWGGSPAEVWMREDLLLKDPEYNRDLIDPYPAARAKWEKANDDWKKQKEETEKAGKVFSNAQPWMTWKPAELYNGMIAPLLPYAVQGAIWYQGESNAGRAWQYRRLFADMIRNWRNDWGRDFTFLEVQLAPWDKFRNRPLQQITAVPTNSDWAELREAQLLATKRLKKVGMAVITDVGDKDDIHPTQKEPVGKRLAWLARKIAYGEKIVADGPAYRSVKFKEGRATLSFDNVGGGLQASVNPGAARELTGFSLAGKDQLFHWADARIDGDKVVVSSADVPEPVAVRYGWADFPVVNLFNREGLPATPFRTDDWEPTTKPRTKAQK